MKLLEEAKKKLTKEEIEEYIFSEEGEGKAGGYSISNYAGRFIEKIGYFQLTL
jgi:predicted house-cleaning NTP pyrophosphatase (Maf/HAM1 superfamily)